MSVGKRVLFVFAVLTLLMTVGLVVTAEDCEGQGRGGSARYGCPVDPPDFDDTEKGDPDPRGRTITDEELWDAHCRPEFDNDPESLNDFRYESHPVADFHAEYLNLDPTGEYIMVYAVCGGPMFDNHRDASGPWYGYGPDGANFDRWVVTVVPPVDIEEIRDEGLPAVEGQVAAQQVVPGEMAPPADAGVVNTRTWLWVENDFDQTIYEESQRGSVTVWVEADPAYTVFDVDGDEIARCQGPGNPYTGGPLNAETDCFHQGFEKPSGNGPFQGTVTIEWVFHWGMGDDYYGEFHTYDATTDLPWIVDEVFSTETG